MRIMIARALYPCIVVVCFVGASPPAEAQTLNHAGKPFPSISLAKPAQGPAIETALGTKFKDLAEWYGHTTTEYHNLVKRDLDLRIDRMGRLHYACPGPAVVGNGTSSTWGYTGRTFTAPYPDSQTFLLHSKPGSTKTIYLDFNGHTTTYAMKLESCLLTIQ